MEEGREAPAPASVRKASHRPASEINTLSTKVAKCLQERPVVTLLPPQPLQALRAQVPRWLLICGRCMTLSVQVQGTAAQRP